MSTQSVAIGKKKISEDIGTLLSHEYWQEKSSGNSLKDTDTR